jgi:hypothetical protein
MSYASLLAVSCWGRHDVREPGETNRPESLEEGERSGIDPTGSVSDLLDGMCPVLDLHLDNTA